MAGHSHVLVPIALQALVVNRNDLARTQWSVSRREFDGPEHKGPVEPYPFVRGNDRPRKGVTLHWSLPDAITRGRRKKDDQSKLLFPFIPNRWLVTRNVESNDRKGAPAAWIIESDFLGAEGSNLYPDVDQFTVTRLGRSFPLTSVYDDAPVARTPFLTATGGYAASAADPIEGDDPAFAANIGGIDNVLSFYDSLEDVIPLNGSDGFARFSYFVMGWHNSAEHDPMNRVARVEVPWSTEKKWQAVLEEYKWSLTDVDADGATAREVLPAATLYHGAVYNVRWTGRERGAAQPFTSSLDSPFAGSEIAGRALETGVTPNPKAAMNPHLPHVAVGNSAVDAMAALIDYLTDNTEVLADDAANNAAESKRRALGQLVQAIEYNALDRYDQPGGRTEFRDEIHSAWFRPSNRGSAWEILEPRDPDRKPEEPVAAIDDAMRGMLDRLNAVQLELDLAERKFTATQRRLYEEAWKLWRLQSDPKPSRVVELTAAGTTEVADLARQAAALRNTIAETGTDPQGARKRRDAARARLISALQAANDEAGAKRTAAAPSLPPTAEPIPPRPGLELRQAPGTRFFEPADPVLLLYGLKRSLTKHGEDGRFAKDQKLTCRVPEQTLSAFSFEGKTLTTAQIDQEFKVSEVSGKLPGRLSAAARNLMLEWLLLDPLANPTLQTLSTIDAAILERAQAIMWADFTELAIPPEQMTDVAGFTGKRPSPLCVDLWSQPWAPLHIAWRVAWFPSAPHQPVKEILSRWEFDGVDYQWTGIADSGDDAAFIVQGRSLLNATTASNTLDALKDLEEAAGKTESAPTPEQIDNLRSQLESIDLMAQSLTGFHDILTRRNPYFQVAPRLLGTADADLLNGVDESAPMPFDNPGRRDFQAFRAGHFRLLRVWVVDAFGQVFDPILERGQSAESFVPLRGSGLAIQLNGNPQFTTARTQRKDTQQLQLPPRLLQAARIEAGFARDDDPAQSPLCGWLLPNHFDKSLAVYDRDGELLGALLQSGSAGAPQLRWDPSVAGPASVADPSLIGDHHLRGFVEGLAAQANPAGAIGDFLETVDLTLRSIDPLGQRSDNLSVLIGRSIAVARLSLQLELEDEPISDPSWAAKPDETSAFAGAKFPIAIGQDGLRDDGTLGYFTDGYSTFHALHRFNPDGDYVKAADVRRDVLLEPSWPGSTGGAPVFVTVLADPRGSIRIRSGILPTTVLRLPRELVERPPQRMDVTFRVGPLLNEPGGIEMPLPADIAGGWSWIERSGIGGLVEMPVTPASHHARMSTTPMHIREGWLRLSDAVGRKEAE